MKMLMFWVVMQIPQMVVKDTPIRIYGFLENKNSAYRLNLSS